jgi:hypothetical protein
MAASGAHDGGWSDGVVEWWGNGLLSVALSSGGGEGSAQGAHDQESCAPAQRPVLSGGFQTYTLAGPSSCA